jgi:hypothetical protein
MFLKTPSTGLKCYDFFCFYISYGYYADGPHDVFTVDYVAAVIDLSTGEPVEIGTIDEPMTASRILELAEQLNQ